MDAEPKSSLRGKISGSPIGRIVALWRYPVKSMAAEPLDEVDVSWHGLAGDRRWAFVRDGVERSGFPWLTIRQRSDMAQYTARFVEPSTPDTSTTIVRTPAGLEFEVVDPELAAELSENARVIKQNRGVFDTFPLSLITTQSVAAIGALVGEELDVRRFRPNLLVEALSDEPFPEDEWVGAVLRIGNATMRVDKRDARCAVVNTDPATAQKDPTVLRVIAGARESCVGVYGATVKPGRVALGDSVYLLGNEAAPASGEGPNATNIEAT